MTLFEIGYKLDNVRRDEGDKIMTITLFKNDLIIYHHAISRLVVHEDRSITITEYYPQYKESITIDWSKEEYDYIEVGDK